MQELDETDARAETGAPTFEPAASQPPATGASRRAWVAAYAALIALLCGVVFSYRAAIVDVPFFTKGEPREALVVQTIHNDGRWVLPLRNGNEIPSKPPLFHWGGALVAAAEGSVTETAIRVPSLVAAVAAIALTALFAFHTMGLLAGLLAAVVLATAGQWVVSATTARVDMVLAATVTMALVAFGYGCRREPARVPALFYLACAAAVLAKGPVGLVLPLAVAVVYLLARGQLAALGRSDFRWAALFLAIPVIWYLAAYGEGGRAFFDKLILKENVFRVLDPDAVEAGHVRPVYAYVWLLLGGFAPWSFFLPVVLADLWRRRGRLEADGSLLPLLWSAVTFALFSAAGSKRAVYLLPAYPAVAMLTGGWWARAITGATRPGPLFTQAMKWAAWLLGAVLVLALTLLMLDAFGARALEMLAPLLSRNDAANLSVISEAARANRQTLLLAVPLTAAMTALLCYGAARNRWALVFASTAGTVAAVSLLTTAVFLPQLAHSQSLRGFMAEVGKEVPPGASLSFFRGFDYGAVFYHGRPIPELDSLDDLSEPDGAWILTWEPSSKELREQASAVGGAQARKAYKVVEVARHTYGDNPREQPLLLLRLREQPGDAESKGN